jgi:hypothetical protein
LVVTHAPDLWCQTEITSVFNDGSRGMELSELAYFNDQLLTFDDRTGIGTPPPPTTTTTNYDL